MSVKFVYTLVVCKDKNDEEEQRETPTSITWTWSLEQQDTQLNLQRCKISVQFSLVVFSVEVFFYIKITTLKITEGGQQFNVNTKYCQFVNLTSGRLTLRVINYCIRNIADYNLLNNKDKP